MTSAGEIAEGSVDWAERLRKLPKKKGKERKTYMGKHLQKKDSWT